MSTQSEAQLEAQLVKTLTASGWAPVQILDDKALWRNLRTELALQNADVLSGKPFSDDEFRQVENHLIKGTIFDRAKTLRERFALTRDDGSNVHIRFFDTDHWCRNRYQVATQINIAGLRKNRYDVTLLVNGLPLCHIELKRRGLELKQAFDQINRYHRESFKAAGGLFQFVQVFVISNGVNTRYYANSPRQSFQHTFNWTDDNNTPINRLDAFANVFLEKCQLSKMIARYVVLNETEKRLMVFRPYQYYAAERILNAVERRTGNGYVWHTTGSGKTLTSFKAAQNVAKLPKVDKVVFVVDRKDLDYQTAQEFESYAPGSVAHSGNTKELVKALTGEYKHDELGLEKRKPVLTTIQKLNSVISRHGDGLASLREGRIVFIFDECHRSQFGDTHKRIRAFFPNAQLFGFTGTPIFAKNAVGKRTTADLFQTRLHTYTITNAIHDQNVLAFLVEYIGAQPTSKGAGSIGDEFFLDAKRGESMSPAQRKAYFTMPARMEAVVEWILKNHNRKTFNRQFGAMLAAGSVDQAIAYMDIFDRLKREGKHNLNLATIFTYGANEPDPEADGLIPEDDIEENGPTHIDSSKRDALERLVGAYNVDYGTKQSVRDGKAFYTYYQDIAGRMKKRDRADYDPEKGIDILIVVNMFLTGFDVRTLNTLYVDKELRHHSLIQAFSRTNRILNIKKAAGQIVCFRDLEERADAAVSLFADKDAAAHVFLGNYNEHLTRFQEKLNALLGHTPTADSVDGLPHEGAQAEFIRLFREVLRLRTTLATFSEYDETKVGIDPQDFDDFKSKYLDLSERMRKPHEGDEDGPLSDIDFELELLKEVSITVEYILGLLARMKLATTSDAEREERKAQILRILSAQAHLHNKRHIIEDFINTHLDKASTEDDIFASFWNFWETKRREDFKALCTEYNLEPAKAEELTAEIIFTGRLPRPAQIRDALTVPTSLLGWSEKAAIISNRIQSHIETFETENQGF